MSVRVWKPPGPTRAELHATAEAQNIFRANELVLTAASVRHPPEERFRL